jgi:hypothetical protein
VRERRIGAYRLVDHRPQVGGVDFGEAFADAAQQGSPGAVVVRRRSFGNSGAAVDPSVCESPGSVFGQHLDCRVAQFASTFLAVALPWSVDGHGQRSTVPPSMLIT